MSDEKSTPNAKTDAQPHPDDSIAALRQRVALLEAQVIRLERNLAGTALYSRAILQSMHEAGTISPTQFREIFDRLDMLDGVKDGR